jgi:tRNA pseudouridine38-40 synthase
MRTFKLTLSYDGTAYCGWQVQLNGPTIQQAVERAWACIVGQRVRVTASGRTDAGVHALRQVASCQAETELPVDRLWRALNGQLPADIRILEVAEVAASFHALRDARKKRYRYLLQDGPLPNVFRRHLTWYVRRPLDDRAMQRAGQALVGRHDFASFQAAGSDRKTTVRTVYKLTVSRSIESSDEVCVEVEADGFLYNMVRNIVGTLVEVGWGRQPVSWPRDILQARNRTVAGRTAPPQGLYLVDVTY